MVKTIKMTKRDLIREHKRLTNLLLKTIQLIENLEEHSIISVSFEQKVQKIYTQLKSEYEDQIKELEEYKQI